MFAHSKKRSNDYISERQGCLKTDCIQNAIDKCLARLDAELLNYESLACRVTRAFGEEALDMGSKSSLYLKMKCVQLDAQIGQLFLFFMNFLNRMYWVYTESSI